jgi:hypothetical protein
MGPILRQKQSQSYSYSHKRKRDSCQVRFCFAESLLSFRQYATFASLTGDDDS